MREFICWAFPACGTPLALAVIRLVAGGLCDLIAGRRSRRRATVKGRSPFSRASEGLGGLGPSWGLLRATRPRKGVCG